MRKIFCADLEIFIDTVTSSQICPMLRTNKSSRDWTYCPVPEVSVCAVGYVVLTWSRVNLLHKLGMNLPTLPASAKEYFSILGYNAFSNIAMLLYACGLYCLKIFFFRYTFLFCSLVKLLS